MREIVDLLKDLRLENLNNQLYVMTKLTREMYAKVKGFGCGDPNCKTCYKTGLGNEKIFPEIGDIGGGGRR